MKRKVVVGVSAALFGLGAGIANAAPADQPGWYGGLDVGRSSLGLNSGNVDGAFANQGITGSTSIDKRDTGVGLNLGYRLNRNLAIEGAYADFGKFNYSTATTAPGGDTIRGTYKANAWSLSAVGIAPMGDNWALFGKLGLARTEAELNAATTTGATAPGNKSHSGTGLVIGGGATYDFTKSVFGKVAWDRYTRVGDSSTGRGDVDLYTVGVGLRF